MFVSVNCFPFTVRSHIINRPSGLEYVLEIWKVKLLKSMATPAFFTGAAAEQSLIACPYPRSILAIKSRYINKLTARLRKNTAN